LSGWRGRGCRLELADAAHDAFLESPDDNFDL
jgi:hypothetical protein